MLKILNKLVQSSEKLMLRHENASTATASVPTAAAATFSTSTAVDTSTMLEWGSLGECKK
jgi:hypothetical protein